MNPVEEGSNQFAALFEAMPAKRIGKLEDIVGAVLYLCSQAGVGYRMSSSSQGELTARCRLISMDGVCAWTGAAYCSPTASRWYWSIVRQKVLRVDGAQMVGRDGTVRRLRMRMRSYSNPSRGIRSPQVLILSDIHDAIGRNSICWPPGRSRTQRPLIQHQTHFRFRKP